MATYLNMSSTDTYDALLSSTLRVYAPKMQDNVTRSGPLWYWLNDKGRRKTQNGGYQIMVPVLYGLNSTVDFFDPYDVFDVTPQEGITTARYDWKNLGGTISISGTDEVKNRGDNAIFNLLEAKVMQLEETMKMRINAYLHGRHGEYGYTFSSAGNAVDSVGGALVKSGEGQFTSLDHIVRQAHGMTDFDNSATAVTHTVGGIQVSLTTTNQGDYYDCNVATPTAQQNAWWMNYSIPGWGPLNIDGTLGTCSTDAELANVGYVGGNSNQNLISGMRTLYNRLSDGGRSPDLGLCGTELYEIYESALMPLERFTDTKVTADAGFSNLKFYGMTLMFDKALKTRVPVTDATAAAPAAPLYMLDSKSLYWIADTQRNFHTTPFITPANQDVKVAKVLVMGNLACNERRRNGVLGCVNFATTPWI